MKTLYEVLEVSELASVDTIRAAYRALSKRYHPDNKKTGNAESFRTLEEAHKVISNVASRTAYDAELAKSRAYETARTVSDETQKKAAKKTKVAKFDPRQSADAILAVGEMYLRSANPAVAEVMTQFRPDLARLVADGLNRVFV